MTVTDIADNIWRNELDSTDLTTIPEVAFWIRSSGLGTLNSLLFTSYTINNTTLEIEPDSFSLDELSVLGAIYLIKFYQSQANTFLGAVGVNDITEYTEKGHTITRLNRTEQSKVFLQLKTQTQEYLNQLVGGYKLNRASPKDVSGIDVLQIVRTTPKYNRVINE